ncbi:MAG: FAD-dependent oxidoreductase [Candidatus Loosdrechtia sp.]|uniref:FAD-dependent oxidoreductase n=1 Tax=Candidatus Loosdrechtia sp. TaxID=3101272 RepID=UPI003A77C452|nr:MAG: FAD-dependent oxidoreductase [Candidatus Jettenia sp. AMX2]
MKYTIMKADDHWFRQNINCQYACPVNTPAMNYIEHIVEGNFNASLRLNFMANLFPYILGRVCTHPCETACRRGVIDEPIAICLLKRSAAEFSELTYPEIPAHVKKTGMSIAIIGSGPSGLAAAHDLALKGHQVSIFEALPVPGGMLSVGIPPYRLPRIHIKNAISWIGSFGIKILLNSPIDSQEKFNTIVKNHDAVYIAAGAHKSLRLNVPGEDLEGVLPGIYFMKETNLGNITSVPERVVVIGGGFTAIDCARSSLRLGAKEVSIVYRRSLKEMPAGEQEVREAEKEGIQVLYLTSPVKIWGENRQVTHIECIKNKLGEPDDKGKRRPVPIEGSIFTLPAQMIISAIGQLPEISFVAEDSGIKIDKTGMPAVDKETFMTTKNGIFAGGDCITGPRNVIEVIADGRKAASSIHTYLTGQKKSGYQFFYKEQTLPERMPGYEAVPRQEQESLPLGERWKLDTESERGLSGECTAREAGRCLLCHYNIFIDETCILCGGCIDVCPYDCISMVSRERIEGENLVVLQSEGAVQNDWDAVMVIDEEKCIRCGLCVRRCPVNAISMKRFAYSVS